MFRAINMITQLNYLNFFMTDFIFKDLFFVHILTWFLKSRSLLSFKIMHFNVL